MTSLSTRFAVFSPLTDFSSFCRFPLTLARYLLIAFALFWGGQSAFAQNVTITVTGTVASGYDTVGVFGPAGTSLTGDSYTLTYTFSNTNGYITAGCGNSGCASGTFGTGSLSPGSAALTINGTTYYFGTTPTDTTRFSAVSQSVPGSTYTSALYASSNYSSDNVSVSITGSATPSLAFDWRAALNSSVVSDSTSTTASFSISGNTAAYGTLSVSGMTPSGTPTCSATPTVSINDMLGYSGTPQPNIINTAVPTYITVTIPSSTTWFPATFSFSNSDMYDFSPIRQTATITPPTGQIIYVNAAYTQVDTGTATACGNTSSNSVTIYDNANYVGGLTTFDVQQSQVSNAQFTDAAALTAAQINTFFSKVNAGSPSFMSAFYWTSIGGSVEAGFFDANGDGVYHQADDGDPYCSDGTTTCVADGTLASSGLSAGIVVWYAADYFGINPELLLDRMQGESGLNRDADLPSDSLLNTALNCAGVGSGTYFGQLSCAAGTFAGWYVTVPSQPYFWPIDDASDSVQYAFAPATGGPTTCADGSLTSFCALVGFSMNNASTYSQYKYNPFVNTSQAGGGFYGFEQIWYQYSNTTPNPWYQ